MPLPKIPSQPATILLAKDYPKASGTHAIAPLAAQPELVATTKKAAPAKPPLRPKHSPQ
jgi:PhoH-like ATPase